MKKFLLLISLSLSATAIKGQQLWTLEECMAYAAEHSTTVLQAQWDAASATATRNEAFGDFFPSVSAQVGTQFNWGRNIDPETNTYKDVTTFNNGYSLYAALTLFDGGQTLNRYKQARAQRRRSVNTVQMQRDDRAIATMMAYADAAYYLRSIEIANDKLRQSSALLALTERQEQLGIKGLPDVAQARATVAADQYDLVHQSNLYEQAMLTLRSTMNLPHEQPLQVDTTLVHALPMHQADNAEAIYSRALTYNPHAIDAEISVVTSKYQYRVAKGNMFPTLSVSAGISTSYYKNISGGYTNPSFSEQFANNRGEYVSATLSIPIFSGLSRFSAVKRAKYALEKAKVARDEQLRRLHDDIAAAILDRDGYAMEMQAMQAKADSDQAAYDLNRRKYEEGLMSLIDMQISANACFKSRSDLLQRQMLYLLKSKLVDYYRGEPLY